MNILIKKIFQFQLKINIRNDFEILFQKDFNLIILTFEEITLFNKDIKNKYYNNANMGKSKIRRFEKRKEKEKIEIIMQEINIPFMWYINLFKERKFKRNYIIT